MKKVSKKTAVKKQTKQSKKAAKKSPPRFTLFDFSATSVARALGKLNWKPAAAIKAIQSKVPKLSAVAIRNSIYVGRHYPKSGCAAPAKLSKIQIAQLKKLAA